MIKLGLRSSRDVLADAALGVFAEELLALLSDLLAASEDIGDPDLLDALETHRRELADLTDAELVADAAASCVETAREAVDRARERRQVHYEELARFVTLVRDTMAVLGGDGDDPSTEIHQAAERFNDLLAIGDVAQLKARLGQEVAHLRTLAETRQKQWREVTEGFMARVAQLEQQLAGVREEASHDPLTKVANRRHFESTLEEHFRTGKKPLVVAIFDLDDFKGINDTHGHTMGDRVLHAVAQGLRTTLRPGDLVARLGGDEFAALLPGISLKQAAARLQSVLGEVGRQLRDQRDLPRVCLSCGAAECSAGDTPQALVARADEALYAAKRQGKNRVAIKSLPFIRELLKR